MSDDFLRVARQEIKAELDALEEIANGCNNDEDIFKNSKTIEGHLHKIKGLAPMMDQEKIGEISRIADVVMKHIIEHEFLIGSYKFIFETIESMKKIFSGRSSYNIVDFQKKAREAFPQISAW